MNAFVQEHVFDVNEWDISSVGWFRDMHPNHMSYELIKSNIKSLVKSTAHTSTVIPQFELSNATAKFQEPGQNKLRTRAIQISCDRKSSKMLHKLLIKALYGVNRDEMWHLENKIIKTGLVTAVHPQ